jgi:hypothetical protein
VAPQFQFPQRVESRSSGRTGLDPFGDASAPIRAGLACGDAQPRLTFYRGHGGQVASYYHSMSFR